VSAHGGQGHHRAGKPVSELDFPGLPVEMEDHLDVGELAKPVGGGRVQDRGVQDQPRHYGAPVASKIWDRLPPTTPIGVSMMGSVIVAGPVWLLRCPLPGGVPADRWFSFPRGRAPPWVVFR
jgi:hypothetical protein